MSDKIETLSGPISLDLAKRILASMHVYECVICTDAFAMHIAKSDNTPEDWIQCDSCNKFACAKHWSLTKYGHVCEQCWDDKL